MNYRCNYAYRDDKGRKEYIENICFSSITSTVYDPKSVVSLYINKKYDEGDSYNRLDYSEPQVKAWVEFLKDCGLHSLFIGKPVDSDPRYDDTWYQIDVIGADHPNFLSMFITLTALRYLYEKHFISMPGIAMEMKELHPELDSYMCLQMAHYDLGRFDAYGHSIHTPNVYKLTPNLEFINIVKKSTNKQIQETIRPLRKDELIMDTCRDLVKKKEYKQLIDYLNT